MPDEIRRLIGYKPSPIQVHSMDLRLSVWCRGFNLAPCRNRMTPECGPPGMVQLIQRGVLRLQPRPECVLTVVTMAIAAKLVRDMPADHGWMVAIPLRKLPVDRMDLLPIDRRSITVVMPEAVQVTDPSRLRAAPRDTSPTSRPVLRRLA